MTLEETAMTPVAETQAWWRFRKIGFIRRQWWRRWRLGRINFNDSSIRWLESASCHFD